MTQPSPEIALWAEYPGGRYQAGVQNDGRALYFVIQADDASTPPRIAWFRNLVPGPMVFPQQTAEDEAPLLPESYCSHPKGLAAPNWDDCRIYWFTQGLGACLFEGEELLALIPPLPDQGLPGFARDCLHPTSVALPLDDDDHYLPYAHHLKSYWQMWAQKSPWPDWQQTLQTAFTLAWGGEYQLYRNSDPSWPPLGVQRLSGETTVLSTVGMGLRAQVGVEKDIQNYRDHQQVELAVVVPDSVAKNEKLLENCVQWMAGLARYPWYHETCFLPGHTLSIPPELSKGFQAERAQFLLENQVTKAMVAQPQATNPQDNNPPESAAQTRPAIALPSFANRPVNLLWLIPLQEASD